MAGLSENGLEIRTQSELQELLEAAVHEAVPGLDLSQGPEHQLIGVLSEELAIAWETLQAVQSSFDPDAAVGVLLDRIAALTGTTRRAATRSRVSASVNLDAVTTLPAGSIAAVLNAPDQQFRTVADVENAAGAAADVDVELESVETGPVAAPAGTLTVIVTGVAGWNSISNPADAELGRDVADDAELRTQRVTELAGAGSGSYAALRADVARVDEVIEVAVIGNETLLDDADGRPGKSFEVVVWDGDPAGADDDEIAQAIWDGKPAGILPYGDGSSGTAVDDSDAEHVIPFTRAAELRTYVEVEAVLRQGTGAGWEAEVVAAIVARGDLYSVGEHGYSSQLVCAVLDAVPAVVAITALTMGIAPSPVTSDVAATYDEIIRIAEADVTVGEAP